MCKNVHSVMSVNIYTNIYCLSHDVCYYNVRWKIKQLHQIFIKTNSVTILLNTKQIKITLKRFGFGVI